MGDVIHVDFMRGGRQTLSRFGIRTRIRMAGVGDGAAPIAFLLNRRFIPVTAVMDRWLAVEYRYFKVSARGRIYILRHDLGSQQWRVLPVT